MEKESFVQVHNFFVKVHHSLHIFTLVTIMFEKYIFNMEKLVKVTCPGTQCLVQDLLWCNCSGAPPKPQNRLYSLH